MTEQWDASTYHRVSDPQFAWGRAVLDRIAFRGDERVLDAGCGSGRLTAELPARVPGGHVVGIDLSEAMVRAAWTTLEAARAPAASWALVCGNLVELPFHEAFDIVFSTATFHWVRDHPRLFACVHRVLRPGGRLEAQCGGRGNLAKLLGRARTLGATGSFQPYLHDWVDAWEFADESTTDARLRRAGFAEVRCWCEPRPTTFDSCSAYAEFVRAVVLRPFLSRLPSAALRDGFVDAIADAAAGDDPPFTLDYWRLNISAARP